MYDAAREVQVRGVAGSVVTRREGSHRLGSALLVAAARPCKGLAAAPGSELYWACARAAHGASACAAVVPYVRFISSSASSRNASRVLTKLATCP